MRHASEFRPAVDALAGRTILITGATGALGEAAANACAAAGATVVLLGRRVPKLATSSMRSRPAARRNRRSIRSIWKARVPTITRNWPQRYCATAAA